MPVTPKQLAQTALTAADQTVYAAPAAPGYAEVLHVTFCNTNAAARTVRLHLVPAGGAAAVGNALVYDWELNIQGLPYNVPFKQVIPAGGLLIARASATGVTMTVTGLEVTA